MSGQLHDAVPQPLGARPGHHRIVLWPHRSLGFAGSAALLSAVAIGLTAPAVAIAGALAWPLILPAIATFAGVAFALWRNNKAADFHEVIDVGSKAIRIERRGAAARNRCVTFNPHWVRLSVETDFYVENRITLRESGRAYCLGSFLAPEERESLAQALREQLRLVREPRKDHWPAV